MNGDDQYHRDMFWLGLFSAICIATGMALMFWGFTR